MIVKAKGGSKKIHLNEEEITLDSLRECANILHPPNVPLNERVTEVSFFKPNIKENLSIEEIKGMDDEWRKALNEEGKVYSILVDEVNAQMRRVAAMRLLFDSDRELSKTEGKQDLKLEKVSFSQVYVEGLGNLKINR